MYMENSQIQAIYLCNTWLHRKALSTMIILPPLFALALGNP